MSDVSAGTFFGYKWHRERTLGNMHLVRQLRLDFHIAEPCPQIIRITQRMQSHAIIAYSKGKFLYALFHQEPPHGFERSPYSHKINELDNMPRALKVFATADVSGLCMQAQPGLYWCCCRYGLWSMLHRVFPSERIYMHNKPSLAAIIIASFALLFSSLSMAGPRRF